LNSDKTFLVGSSVAIAPETNLKKIPDAAFFSAAKFDFIYTTTSSFAAFSKALDINFCGHLSLNREMLSNQF